jgi:hypothetical protein
LVRRFTQFAFDVVEPSALGVERSTMEVVEQPQVAAPMWKLARPAFHRLEVAVTRIDLRA